MKQPAPTRRASYTPVPSDRRPAGDFAPRQAQAPAARPLRIPLLSPAIEWWFTNTSNTRYLARTFDERIRARRSRVGSGLFLGLILLSSGLLVWERLTTGDMPTFYALLAALVGLTVGCLLNRYNHVEFAGALVALVIDGAIFGAVLSAPGGLLDTDYLGSYYLLALILGVVAILLPSWALLVATTVNCILIVVDFMQLQGYTPALAHQLASDGYFFEIGRPIVLNIGIAVSLYIVVRTLLDEGRRADNAEEMAALEHSITVQRQQLEIGVQQILETHVRIANGDYSARAPMIQDSLLWQIASSLNNLMSRLQKSGQAEHQLRRTEDELRRLAVAIDDAAMGKRPIWPAPSGTAADLIIERVTGRNRSAMPAQMAQGLQGQQQWPPLPPGRVPPPPFQEAQQQPGAPIGTTGILRAPGTGPLEIPDFPPWQPSGPLPYPGQNGQPGQAGQAAPNSRPSGGPENPWFVPPEA